MHCQQCGAQISEKARFCGSCGAPVGTQPQGERRSVRERLAAAAGRSRRERILTMGTVAALAVAALAFVLLDAEGDPEYDAFTRTADAQCVEAKAQVARAGRSSIGSTGAGGRERLVGSIVAAVTEWRLALEGLDASPEQRARTAGLREALFELAAAGGALNREIRSGTEREIIAQSQIVDEITARVEAEVARSGLRECETFALTPGPDSR